MKSPKIFLRDTGILHHLLRIDSLLSLQGNPVIGASWEGYVLEQVIQLAGQKSDLYFYRTHQGTECDIVFVKGKKPLAAIECKYSASPKVTKSLLTTILDLNTKSNFIITPTQHNYLIRENIRVCGLVTFLKEYLPGLRFKSIVKL